MICSWLAAKAEVDQTAAAPAHNNTARCNVERAIMQSPSIAEWLRLG
jgi:hypothetical protein